MTYTQAALVTTEAQKLELLGLEIVRVKGIVAVFRGDEELCQMRKDEFPGWLVRCYISHLQDADMPKVEPELVTVVFEASTQMEMFA